MRLEQQTLGQLATSIPGATAVFREYRLDFCCGGSHSLAEAAADRDLPLGALVERLQSLSQARTGDSADGWADRSAAELIEHILTRYHDVHRQQLPELIRLAGRVERVHGGHPQCPAGLTDQLEHMQEELLMHMDKEEGILFPMLARGLPGVPLAPIQVMKLEHEQHGHELERLQALTHQLSLPEDACNTWRALYAGLNTLVEDLMEHIHLENNVLFPKALGR